MSKAFPPWQKRDLRAERSEAYTLGKGHGRVEHRHLVSSTTLNEHLDWPGVQQVCRVVRTITRQGETTTEVEYAITSADREQANAAQLLQWWRGHWGIENRLHWIRDETFGEDRSRVRTGHAPQILAGVRNAVINWLRAAKVTHVAAALRQNAWNSQRLFTKLGKPIL